MEAQMAKVYTRKVFNLFQDEISQSHVYFVGFKCEDELQIFYTTSRANASSISRQRELTYNKSLDFVSCSCQHFEFKDGSNLLMTQLEYVHDEIQKMNIGKSVHRSSPKDKNIHDMGQSINDPSRVRAKGCDRRLKSSKEKAMSKERVCSGCGHNGHDKRTCPKKNLPPQDFNGEDFISISGSDDMSNGNIYGQRNLFSCPFGTPFFYRGILIIFEEF